MLIYLIKTCLLKLLQKIKNAEHKTSLYQYSTFNQITNSFLIIIDNWEQVDARVISTNWPGALISKTSVYSKYVLIHKLCDNFTCFSDVSVKEIASQPAAQQQIDDVPGSSRSSWKSKLRKSFRKKKGTQKSAGKKKETKKNEIGSRSTLKWITTHSCIFGGAGKLQTLSVSKVHLVWWLRSHLCASLLICLKWLKRIMACYKFQFHPGNLWKTILNSALGQVCFSFLWRTRSQQFAVLQVGEVWDPWNGFCFLAIFRITLLQID